MFQRLIFLFILLLSSIGACLAEAAPPHYRVVEIERRLILDGPHCINDSGVVAGAMVVPPKPKDQRQYLQTHRWKNGRLTNLKIIEGAFPSSAPAAINNQGQIVGALDYGNGEMNFHSWGHAFFWESGHWQDLSALLPGEVSHAVAVNDKGEVLVSTQESELLSLDYPDPGVQQPSYLYRKGKIYFLGYQRAIALNNKSQVLLKSWGGQYFLWDQGKETHLPAFDNASLNPRDMNDRQQIIGQAGEGAFLYQDGQTTLLYPGREYETHGHASYANAINNAGQIIGYANFRAPGGKDRYKIWSRALLWQNSKMYDLNSLIPARSGWVLERATGISDHGLIVGEGIHHGRHTNFLLWPITQPVKSSKATGRHRQ